MLHKNNKKQTDPNLSKETEQEDCCVSSENELAKLQSAFEQAQNKYLRVLADYQNLQKRVEDDRFNMVFFANEKLFKKLLFSLILFFRIVSTLCPSLCFKFRGSSFFLILFPMTN